MQRVSAEPYNYEFSRHLQPRVRIEPGETIVVDEPEVRGRLAEISRDEDLSRFIL